MKAAPHISGPALERPSIGGMNATIVLTATSTHASSSSISHLSNCAPLDATIRAASRHGSDRPRIHAEAAANAAASAVFLARFIQISPLPTATNTVNESAMHSISTTPAIDPDPQSEARRAL
nr:hypothetical protein [Bifidobacterium psychraerophilum]